MDIKKITDKFSVTPQITPDEIDALVATARAGIEAATCD